MSNKHFISDEQLNALLDNELDDAERARLFESIRNDKELSARYCKLRQVKEMVTLAYNEPPLPKNGIPGLSQQRFVSKISMSAAAMVLLFLGVVIGLANGIMITRFRMHCALTWFFCIWQPRMTLALTNHWRK